MLLFPVFSTKYYYLRSEWRDTVRNYNDEGTLSIIMTENIKRHPERTWRICHREEINRKNSVGSHESYRFFTLCHIAISRFSYKAFLLRSEWRDTVRNYNDEGTLSIIMTENIKRHPERTWRICHREEINRKNSVGSHESYRFFTLCHIAVSRLSHKAFLTPALNDEGW